MRKPKRNASPVQMPSTMYYVVPRAQAHIWQGSKFQYRNLTCWGVFATPNAASEYIASTNRRLVATVVPL